MARKIILQTQHICIYNKIEEVIFPTLIMRLLLQKDIRYQLLLFIIHLIIH